MEKKFKPNQYFDPFEGKLGQRIIETRIEENERLDREQQSAIDLLPFTVVRDSDYRAKILNYGKPGFYATWVGEHASDEDPFGFIKALYGVTINPYGKRLVIQLSEDIGETYPNPGKWEAPESQ